MTIFFPDISGFQTGIDLKGALAVICKATEDTNYANPDFPRARANSAQHGTFFMAYHFLHAGNAAKQAEWCFMNVGHATPLMLDVEPTTGSNPSLADVATFVAEYRKLGGIIHLIYLPHWYWQNLGSPAFATVFASAQLVLVSSEYTSYTDASGVRGWQPYGGVTPSIWQYTESMNFNGVTCDFNAFRGSFAGKQDSASVKSCLAELESLAKTGRLPTDPPAILFAQNPIRNLWAVRSYTTAEIGWDKAQGATFYRVNVWQRRKLVPLRKRVSTMTITGNKTQLTNLKLNTTYEVSVVALPASEWAQNNRTTVIFRTK